MKGKVPRHAEPVPDKSSPKETLIYPPSLTQGPRAREHDDAAADTDGFEKSGKTTRRAQFLAEMDRVVQWAELCVLTEPYYPKWSAEGERPPLPLERMSRVYFLQQWFNLSDPAVEEALFDPAAMRDFAGNDQGRDAAPDETTVCKFPHLLERRHVGKKLLATVTAHMKRKGIKSSNGTIVDVTIISAPSSTKKRDGERDPEMHQAAKGQQWYFGMKAHVAVDSRTKLFHTVLVSAANVADRDALPDLLHGRETRVWGDRGYHGQAEVIRRCAPAARDLTNRRDRHHGRADETIKGGVRNSVCEAGFTLSHP